MTFTKRFGVAFAVAVALLLAVMSWSSSQVSASAADQAETVGPEPLVDVHELMESVVGKAFEGAKKGLSEKPADRKAWSSVFSMSVLLGESGNLLLFRKPEDAEPKQWKALAVGLRDRGQDLIQATKAKDYDASKKAYTAVVEACNKCHTKFATDGEPKIEP